MNYDPFEQSATGEEIKDWIWYHSHHKTRHTKIARTMNKFFNLDNDKIYILRLCDGAPVATEVFERRKAYDIPCND